MATAKKTSKKRTTKKKAQRRELGKGSVTYFMGQLINAGYLGDEIPESAGDQGRAAQRIRQMAEKLARQTLKHGDEDVSLSAE